MDRLTFPGRKYKKDVKLLADAVMREFAWQIDAEHIGLDHKRPFGNSCIPKDIAEIIGFRSEDRRRDGLFNDDEKMHLLHLYWDSAEYIRDKWFKLTEK